MLDRHESLRNLRPWRPCNSRENERGEGVFSRIRGDLPDNTQGADPRESSVALCGGSRSVACHGMRR